MAPSPVQQAKVKAALSGDTLVLASVHNFRQERTLSLAFVDAPRLRRDNEEAHAFAAREFLIKSLVGKVVQFQVLYTIPGTGANSAGREYGTAVLQSGQAFPDASVAAGWARLRDDAAKKMDEKDAELARAILDRLELAQAQARADSKGTWASDASSRITNSYDVQDAKAFAEQHKGKPLEAVAERVLAGDRLILRFLLSPTKHLQTLGLVAGIRAPATKRTNASDGREQPGEPLGAEAAQFLEQRILQRTLDVRVVGASPQGQLICAVAHKEGGDMAAHLLRQGLARCSDHHSTLLGTETMAALRKAEQGAKEAKLNLFRDHASPAGAAAGGAGALAAEMTVMRVQTADTIYARSRGGPEKRLSLASIRQPKPSDPAQAPYQAAAKEFLRKRLIGKHVRVAVVGTKAASDGFEARDVATVTQGGKDVAVELVAAGWATAIRHRRDDTDRSPAYDELLAAEEAATKGARGLHSGKPPPAPNYVDYSASAQKAKMQAGVLTRQRKIPAVVDFVRGASRFVLLVPRENAKLTLVLAGIRAPRAPRMTAGGGEGAGAGAAVGEGGEPQGREALEFATRKCLQRDVEIDVAGTDKVGCFVGTLYVNRESFARSLVEEGLATVHAHSAEQSDHGPELFAAEERAKEARKGLWKDYDANQDGTHANGTAEATAPSPAAPTEADANGTTADAAAADKPLDYREVVVTHVDPATLRLRVQIIGNSTTGALEELMRRFRAAHLASNAHPLPTTVAGAPPAKVGALVSARFSADGQWYRARVRRHDRAAKAADVMYVDYGNAERVAWSDLRALPAAGSGGGGGGFGAEALAPQAREAALSFVQFPQPAMSTGPDASGGPSSGSGSGGMSSGYAADAAAWLEEHALGRDFVASIDHEEGGAAGVLYVTLFPKDLEVRETGSVNAAAVGDGVGVLARKLRPWERARAPVLAGVRAQEAEAREARRGVWEYGDLTED